MAEATMKRPSPRFSQKNEAAPAQSESSGSENKVWEKRPEVSYWREKDDGKGVAVIVEYNQEKQYGFLTFMPQNPDKNADRKFLRDLRIQAMLGKLDMAEMINVLRGRKEGLGKKNDKGFWSGLFHENEKGNAVIGLTFSEQYGLQLSLSTKRTEGESAKYQITLNSAEATLLELFLENCIKNTFNFQT